MKLNSVTNRLSAQEALKMVEEQGELEFYGALEAVYGAIRRNIGIRKTSIVQQITNPEIRTFVIEDLKAQKFIITQLKDSTISCLLDDTYFMISWKKV